MATGHLILTAEPGPHAHPKKVRGKISSIQILWTRYALSQTVVSGFKDSKNQRAKDINETRAQVDAPAPGLPCSSRA